MAHPIIHITATIIATIILITFHTLETYLLADFISAFYKNSFPLVFLLLLLLHPHFGRQRPERWQRWGLARFEGHLDDVFWSEWYSVLWGLGS